MKQILEEKLNKTFREEHFQWHFEIQKEGVYGIEIIALAKSWQQNLFKSFFKDDNLTVKIDNLELANKYRSWNGNTLRGLKQTNFYILKLIEGDHDLNFTASQYPQIQTIRIYQIGENEISYHLKDNYPIQEGQRRPWLTIALCNLGLDLLKIKASANEGKKFLFFQKDDSDLKLIIDGNIQQNSELKSHKNWFWCGRVLKGKTKTFEKELNLKLDLHFFEFWADRNPEVEEIIVKLEGLKRIPTVDDPKWTGDFADDPEEILLARLVFGEARNQPQEAKIWVAWSIINRIGAKAWPDTLYEVILQPGQYDPFKPTDPNYSIIIDPLNGADAQTVDAWKECYEIARVVVNKETENPTSATHFHGIGISREQFETNVVPDGKFLKKIGDTYFYWSPN